MITITKQFIQDSLTTLGGLTGAQCDVLKQSLNLPDDYKAKSGWLKALHGQQLTNEQAQAFKLASVVYAKEARQQRKANMAVTGCTHCPTCLQPIKAKQRQREAAQSMIDKHAQKQRQKDDNTKAAYEEMLNRQSKPRPWLPTIIASSQIA